MIRRGRSKGPRSVRLVGLILRRFLHCETDWTKAVEQVPGCCNDCVAGGRGDARSDGERHGECFARNPG
jgi:hypothetical protein